MTSLNGILIGKFKNVNSLERL